MTRLVIAPAALQGIRAHAAAVYPDECCGALLGLIGSTESVRVLEALALPNTTEEGARRRFLVRPNDYRAAESRARERGAELVGFYHSHPDHEARPSQYDLEHAWPNLSYVIVQVVGGRPLDIRSWRLREDRSSFFEEELPRSEHDHDSVDSDAAAAVYRQARHNRG
jgi:proteasome lid subunit RPN8/RPN11